MQNLLTNAAQVSFFSSINSRKNVHIAFISKASPLILFDAQRLMVPQAGKTHHE
jgi:hypothetical protein